MPFSNLNLDELARHTGINARELRRMAERGKLPGQLIGGEWRFNRARLHDWLQQEMHGLEEPQIRSLERATAIVPDAELVGSLLRADGIELHLPARSRASVIRELVTVAQRTGLVYDRDGLIAAIEEREELGPTALPRGLAIPHPRRPLPWATAEPLICVGRVESGVPFCAPDRRLTDLFFLVISHDERDHLHVLARLSLLLSSELPDELREAPDAPAALELILGHERKLLARRR
ncbi:MAG: PTS sugar transporter subunit IIA [Phycisphaerae bacterium]